MYLGILSFLRASFRWNYGWAGLFQWNTLFLLISFKRFSNTKTSGNKTVLSPRLTIGKYLGTSPLPLILKPFWFTSSQCNDKDSLILRPVNERNLNSMPYSSKWGLEQKYDVTCLISDYSKINFTFFGRTLETPIISIGFFSINSLSTQNWKKTPHLDNILFSCTILGIRITINF